MALSIQLLDHDDDGRQEGDPTPEEIRKACLRIQHGWDRRTQRVRAGCFAKATPELAVVDVPLAVNF